MNSIETTDTAKSGPMADHQAPKVGVDIPATLAHLRAKLEALGSQEDVPLTTTRAMGEWEANASQLRGLIRNITTYAPILEEATTSLAAWEQWQSDLWQMRQQLCDELMDLPPRDRRLHNLTLSLQVVDRGVVVIEDSGYGLDTLRLGELLRDRGVPWRGCLLEVEKRVRLLRNQREQALDIVAEALTNPLCGR